MWELQRFWDVQTAGNKTETLFDCDLENLDRKKISDSEWLMKLRAKEDMMSYSSWMLKTETLSRKK